MYLEYKSSLQTITKSNYKTDSTYLCFELEIFGICMIRFYHLERKVYMSEIKWATPPTSVRKAPVSRLSALAQAGIANPGSWFILSETAKSRPAYKPFNGPMWERAYRKEESEGKVVHRLYVRYIGHTLSQTGYGI